jgi:hypothetical protein
MDLIMDDLSLFPQVSMLGCRRYWTGFETTVTSANGHIVRKRVSTIF